MNTTLIRTKRRTLCIQVHPEKGVIIRAPFRLSEHRIEKFLKEKENWIKAKTSKQIAQNTLKPKYKFEPGERFPFLGRPTIPPHHTKEKIIDWYKKEAFNHLTKRTGELARLAGRKVQPKTIHIRSYRSRWGTCHRDNSITYNWKIIMAPPEIIDYLIAHELAHIPHKNHGPAFKKTLALLDPNYKNHQKWLRTNGQNLAL